MVHSQAEIGIRNMHNEFYFTLEGDGGDLQMKIYESSPMTDCYYPAN